MALQATVDTLDDVPEPLREFYTEQKDGGFRLDAEGVEFADDVAGLKSALAKRTKAEDVLRRDLVKLKGQYDGIDPERYQELMDASEAAETKKAEAKGEWDTLKAQMAEKNQKALGAKDEEIARLKSSHEALLIDGKAVDAIVAAEGEPLLLLHHVRRRAKVVEEEGRQIVRVLNEDGTPMMDDSGNYAGFPALVDELKGDPKFGRAFEPSGATGGGAGGEKRSSRGGKTFDRSDPMAWGDPEAIAKGEKVAQQ